MRSNKKLKKDKDIIIKELEEKIRILEEENKQLKEAAQQTKKVKRIEIEFDGEIIRTSILDIANKTL